jgi:phosphonate transport system substrate-binding protein
VERPEDLRRARVAWVAPTSASGYLFSRLALLRRGLNPAVLFGTENFYDAHGRVAAAVLEGRADVGATFAVYQGGDPARPLVRAGFLGAVPGRAARVIDVAGPIPADMIVAVPAVPISQRSALTVALQRIGEVPAAQQPLRALFGVEGFRAFSSASLRSLVDLGADLAGPAGPPAPGAPPPRQQPSIPPPALRGPGSAS